MKLEVQIIPVSDVDRAKQFYERLGWRLDDDVAPLDGLRIVQFTPPGSGTPVTFATGLTASAPGSSRRRPRNPASPPRAPAMGRSARSPIPTATCGWSRRSRRASPAGYE